VDVAAVLSRGDEPDLLPRGWVQVGTDGEGRPLYGYLGPRTPRWYFNDPDDMRRR
jgi:hypothetical protein